MYQNYINFIGGFSETIIFKSYSGYIMEVAVVDVVEKYNLNRSYTADSEMHPSRDEWVIYGICVYHNVHLNSWKNKEVIIDLPEEEGANGECLIWQKDRYIWDVEEGGIGAVPNPNTAHRYYLQNKKRTKKDVIEIRNQDLYEVFHALRGKRNWKNLSKKIHDDRVKRPTSPTPFTPPHQPTPPPFTPPPFTPTPPPFTPPPFTPTPFTPQPSPFKPQPSPQPSPFKPQSSPQPSQSPFIQVTKPGSLFPTGKKLITTPGIQLSPYKPITSQKSPKKTSPKKTSPKKSPKKKSPKKSPKKTSPKKTSSKKSSSPKKTSKMSKADVALLQSHGLLAKYSPKKKKTSSPKKGGSLFSWLF